MKQTITLIALSMGILTSHAQIAFPLDNAVWKQRHGIGEAPPTYSLIGTKNTSIVLDGTTYHKLYQSFDDGIFTESEYIGGIREASGGKVYYRAATASTERMIYDFSVVVGDTITDAITNTKSGVVVSVDYVTIGSIVRKRITFRQQSSSAAWSSGTWIEGIGNSSLGGLLGSPMLQPTCDCSIKTICLTVDGNTNYQNPNYTDLTCDLPTETKDLIATADNVLVLPNPIHGDGKISWIGSNNYRQLFIYDVAGRIVWQTSTIGKNEISLPNETFTPGIYIFQLVGETNNYKGKFLIN